jgi:X-X-X-Leu-X-X-Gly heptad repeat protein
MPGIDITAMPFSMQIEQPDTAALLGGFTQLSGAAGEISAGVGASEDAASQVADAAAALAARAASDPMLGGAVAERSGGLTALRDGLSELHTGTETLAGETAGIPGRVQAELDTLIGAYTGGGFEPVSFASKTNQDIAFVQFVFKTDGIQKPAVKAPETEESEPSGFWDRLGKLFGR